MRFPLVRSPRPGRTLPSLLLALLLMGTALHVVHHLTDTDCERGGANAHPCLTCSAFHSIHVGVTSVGAAAPIDVPTGRAFVPPVVRIAAVLIRAASSRAPPSA
jgi:hypothetical protein